MSIKHMFCWRLLSSSVFTARRHYNRLPFKKFSRTNDPPDEEEIFYEDSLENDILQSMLDKDNDRSMLKKKKVDLEAERRKFLKKKIQQSKLKKLHFEKMPKLVTWAARLQMQHLHKQDPTYWTPEMLSRSFPVTPELVLKILRGKPYPKNEYELYKYDQEVYDNWLQLKEARHVGHATGPLDPTYRLLVAGDKLGLLANAAGASNHPIPDMKNVLLAKAKEIEEMKQRRLSKTAGEFSAILENYKPANEGSSGNNVSYSHKGSLEDTETAELLNVISKPLVPKSSVSNDCVKDDVPRNQGFQAKQNHRESPGPAIPGNNSAKYDISTFYRPKPPVVENRYVIEQKSSGKNTETDFDEKTLTFDRQLQKRQNRNKGLKHSTYSAVDVVQKEKRQNRYVLEDFATSSDNAAGDIVVDDEQDGGADVLSGSLEDIHLLNTTNASSRRAKRIAKQIKSEVEPEIL